MNRALADHFSYYCMVNCHLLSYAICKYIERRLVDGSINDTDNFGLCFIYAEENKGARIRAHLDKHLLRDVTPVDLPKLQDYVKHITRVEEGVKSASSVDPVRCGITSCRLI